MRLCAGGYTGEPFSQGVKSILGERVTVKIEKLNERHAFKLMPKRWIVECSFAWLEKHRRLWKNCDRNTQYLTPVYPPQFPRPFP